jgi:hypothetical protein
MTKMIKLNTIEPDGKPRTQWFSAREEKTAEHFAALARERGCKSVQLFGIHGNGNISKVWK